MPEYRVHVKQLRVGVFIRLELGWVEHPFLFRSFKIKNQDQIDTLKELGITSVVCVPEKSDRPPTVLSSKFPLGYEPEPEKVHREAGADYVGELWELKNERIARLKKQREQFEACEKRFDESIERVKSVMENLRTTSREAIDEARAMVSDLAGSILSEKDVVIHLMNTKASQEEVYYHSLNTAVLGMILARECGLDAENVEQLGLGLICHDIGKYRIEKKILYKRSPLTPAEQQLFRLHTKYGEEMISKIPKFPTRSREIIAMHHETLDGAGYPSGLTGDRIPSLVKIAAITNAYDNHCNKLDQKTSLTPHQALSLMFSRQQKQLDPELLALFVRCLGIYPPGAIVQLSNDSIGIVVSVNSKNALRPSVLLYDPDIPKKDALVFDLSDDLDITITRSIHPSRLPAPVYDYLSPRSRVTYFAEPAEAD